QPDWGLAAEIAARLRRELHLIVNSSGLTDFNPDLRDALVANVDAAVNVVEFVRSSNHAGLLHLSTCYVAGGRDGRISEKIKLNYTPSHLADFDAEREWKWLHEMVARGEKRAESPEFTKDLLKQALEKAHAAKDLKGAALNNQIRKTRIRWLRNYMIESGTRRAKELGWPNTYTLTKSLAESLIGNRGKDLPIA